MPGRWHLRLVDDVSNHNMSSVFPPSNRLSEILLKSVTFCWIQTTDVPTNHIDDDNEEEDDDDVVTTVASHACQWIISDFVTSATETLKLLELLSSWPIWACHMFQPWCSSSGVSPKCMLFCLRYTPGLDSKSAIGCHCITWLHLICADAILLYWCLGIGPLCVLWVERIDLFHFRAGCHKRRLNQGLSSVLV